MTINLDYNPELPLHLHPNQRFSMAQVDVALGKAFDSPTPVLIYVHGRAAKIGEPKKSVETGIYDELKAYGTSVLGFTWDADDGGYDETRPLASCEDFDKLLDALAGFLGTHQGRKPSLLCHSMGNLIVAEEAKDDRLTSARGAMFSNVVLTSAAVKAKRHASWLDKIGVADRIYVTANEHDVVLGFAGALFRPNMLGKQLVGPAATSAKVTYVDVSDCDVNHRYFVPQGQKHHANITKFYRQALTGEPVAFATIANTSRFGDVPTQKIIP